MESVCFLYFFWIYRSIRKWLDLTIARQLEHVELPCQPSYNATRNVTVVVPTIDPSAIFAKALLTWIANGPLEVIVVTTTKNLLQAQAVVSKALNSDLEFPTEVKVLDVPQAGKRRQLACGIQIARGSIIVLADDDAIWPSKLLPHILACFEWPNIGGVGTRQRAYLPLDINVSVWEYLAAPRLKKRNVKISVTNFLDGTLTCLSGRTAAYRAKILKDPTFIYSFTNDYWRGKWLLDSGDDTFITRWLLLNNWGMKVQSARDAEVSTTVYDSARYVKQLLRWNRNSKRSYLGCIFGIPGLWM